MPMHPVLRGVDPDAIRAQATADGHMVVVTDDLLRVGSQDRLVLDVAIHIVRRIQLDLERDRPATLVSVPVSPSDEPQVFIVQPEELRERGRSLGGDRAADARSAPASNGEDPDDELTTPRLASRMPRRDHLTGPVS